ncbi:MAG: RepB family DNA primase, partial [Anaerolineaceae bacterium]|nr:RepB family DNA primase [Anaerolineaceae bacterium]
MISIAAEKIGLTPDLIQAERYLSILDEGAEAFCFQTFDDLKSRKSKALASIRQGSFEKWGAFLAQMNNSGGGVFVTVNESDGQGRKLENITRIRTIWHEEDTPCNKKFPLEPHLLIESSPGKYHRYWLVDGLSQSDFSGVMRRMIQDYGSDPNVKDTARVLRIPGFYHQKDPEHPFMVRIISESGGLPYSAETIMKAFPPLEAAQVIPMHRTTEAPNDGATKALVAELASRASRRTHEDPHKGRHTQVLWLGFECAARGVPIDYAEYAIKVFSRLMRQTDTTGKPTAINFESEVT